MADFDLVLRGGTVADGTGAPLREVDVAVEGGRIAAVGGSVGQGAEEIDAQGLLVTPGFVDVHTHYDGQATWDDRLTPSSNHGVTTAVMGNCGVGLLPAARRIRHPRPLNGRGGGHPRGGAHGRAVLELGKLSRLPQALEARDHDIDFAAQLPHAALRVYVMGERGARREPATAADIQAMAQLTREAMAAGALGFSTSRTLNHQTADGDPTPTLTAAEDELMAIALAMRAEGKGVLQFVSDFQNPREEMAMLRRLVEQSGRPCPCPLRDGGAPRRLP